MEGIIMAKKLGKLFTLAVTAGTAAAEHRGIAATENDAHTFLAGLQENENDEHHTNNDMKRQNKGLHKSLPGARRK